MWFYAVALPVLIVALKFSLRLFVHNRASLTDCLIAALALPIDVTFLSISLVAASIIAARVPPQFGLLLFTVLVIYAVLAVVIWRGTESLLLSNRYYCVFGALTLGYFLSMVSFSLSIACIAGVFND